MSVNANLKILIPEATTNYILNPAFRYITDPWVAVGATITRSLDQARWNIASMKVVTNGAALNEGAYYRVSALAGVSEPITASIYARGNLGNEKVRIRLVDNPVGREYAGLTVSLRCDRWTRLDVSGFSTGRDDLRLYVESADLTAKVFTFYADGAQMERKSYATSYADGDQPGCTWNIVSHASTSTRDAYTREGGRWIGLAGPCREVNDDIYVTMLSGLGMAPITNNVQPWALTPGSFFGNVKVNNRVMTLNFTVKHKTPHFIGTPDLGPLHLLRQQLIDVFKPDRTGGNESFWFSYQEGDRELFIRLRYEAGLEGQWDIRNGWVNSFPVRLVAVEPEWVEDDQEVANLSISDNMAVPGYALTYHNGQWGHMNYGFNNLVLCLAAGKQGQIYAGGMFTIVNNNAAAVAPFFATNRIAYWDGTKWNSMAGGANNSVYAIAVAPNGDVYAGGDFTSIGGVACNRIAKWNGTAWSALSTGANGRVRSIAVAPNGDVYIGGDFTQAGGFNTWYCARWNGLTWISLGAGAGLNNSVRSLCITQDGLYVYLTGQFTDEKVAVAALGYVTKYTVSSNTFSAMASGVGGEGGKIVISPNGIIHVAASVVGVVKQWNGSAWVLLGKTGLTFTPFLPTTCRLTVTPDENIIVLGEFTYADDLPVYRIARWNGSSWVNADISLAAISAGYDLLISGNDIYLALPAGRADWAAITLVQYTGTQSCYPVIYIYGAGTLLWIENLTTKQRLYLNMTVLAGEEVFIDLGTKTIKSLVRGNLSYTLLNGSNFGSFSLIPGENKLAVFMVNDVNAEVHIYNQPQHWSADASETPEALT